MKPLYCSECGKQAVAIAHGGTDVIAFYVCWDCEKIMEKVEQPLKTEVKT